MMRVAELYGGSLYDLAAEEQQERDLLEEMQGVQRLFRENPQYVALLSEPSIPKEKRLELLDQAFRTELKPYLLNFLKLITERGLLFQYAGMCRAYEQRYNAAHNIAEALVRTAVPLKEAERGRLKEALEKQSKWYSKSGLMRVCSAAWWLRWTARPWTAASQVDFSPFAKKWKR